jgi:hypothetical protein
MARPHIPEEASSYYPPRARWYSALFHLGDLVHRRLALERLTMPRTMTIGELFAGFFVPGLAVWLRGPRAWGWTALVASAALLIIFIVGLGYPFANAVFGLLISLHCTGFVYYCRPLLATERFRGRLGFTVLVLLAIGWLIYLPARGFIQGHWLTPLRMNGRVLVVQRISRPPHIRRGDWVAYGLDENAVGANYHGGMVRLKSNVSLGPVLALPGDVVDFSPNGFSVDGVLHASLPHMPVTGEFTVGENEWFIWPNLGISGYGDVGEARISSALLGLSRVPESSYFGKPFHRWFGRKQTLP